MRIRTRQLLDSHTTSITSEKRGQDYSEAMREPSLIKWLRATKGRCITSRKYCSSSLWGVCFARGDGESNTAQAGTVQRNA